MDNASLDFRIRTGTLIDLSGTPWQGADAVIRDDRLATARQR